MYANDDKNGFIGYGEDRGNPAVPPPGSATDSWYVLHPARTQVRDWSGNVVNNLVIGTPIYVKNLATFACPSTDNKVTDPNHLRDIADGPADASGRHSYEPRTWMWEFWTFPDGYVVPEAKAPDTTKTMKTLKNCKRGSESLLLTDTEDSSTGGSIDNNNWPDIRDNHGADGFNMGFLDGHVSFVLRGRAILEAYVNGHYPPGVSQAIFDRYRLQNGPVMAWY
jgi:prepilin-type processing-associated H-X9-DG protein